MTECSVLTGFGTHRAILRKGQSIYYWYQQEPAERRYVLDVGLVALTVRAAWTFAILRPPATFGETTVVNNANYPTSAQAIDATRVLVVPRDGLLQAVAARKAVRDTLFLIMADQQRAAIDRTADAIEACQDAP